MDGAARNLPGLVVQWNKDLSSCAQFFDETKKFKSIDEKIAKNIEAEHKNFAEAHGNLLKFTADFVNIELDIHDILEWLGNPTTVEKVQRNLQKILKLSESMEVQSRALVPEFNKVKDGLSNLKKEIDAFLVTTWQNITVLETEKADISAKLKMLVSQSAAIALVALLVGLACAAYSPVIGVIPGAFIIIWIIFALSREKKVRDISRKIVLLKQKHSEATKLSKTNMTFTRNIMLEYAASLRLTSSELDGFQASLTNAIPKNTNNQELVTVDQRLLYKWGNIVRSVRAARQAVGHKAKHIR